MLDEYVRPERSRGVITGLEALLLASMLLASELREAWVLAGQNRLLVRAPEIDRTHTSLSKIGEGMTNA
jgi:hypothetical protein